MSDIKNNGGRTRGAGRTREIILDAAETVFAQNGFAGTRVDVISNIAGYNTGLIFRYFGDKLGLYTEVIRCADEKISDLLKRVYAPLLDEESTNITSDCFRAFLKNMIKTLLDYLFENPKLVRILTWEMANGWQTLIQITPQMPTDDSSQFENFFRKALNTGMLRTDFIPFIQYSMIVQISQAYLASIPMYQRVLPEKDLTSSENLTAARDYLVDFIVAGIMIDPKRA